MGLSSELKKQGKLPGQTKGPAVPSASSVAKRLDRRQGNADATAAAFPGITRAGTAPAQAAADTTSPLRRPVTAAQTSRDALTTQRPMFTKAPAAKTFSPNRGAPSAPPVPAADPTNFTEGPAGANDSAKSLPPTPTPAPPPPIETTPATPDTAAANPAYDPFVPVTASDPAAEATDTPSGETPPAASSGGGLLVFGALAALAWWLFGRNEKAAAPIAGIPLPAAPLDDTVDEDNETPYEQIVVDRKLRASRAA